MFVENLRGWTAKESPTGSTNWTTMALMYERLGFVSEIRRTKDDKVPLKRQ